jgi:NAD+--asparagine ADP-ribosyltransferase
MIGYIILGAFIVFVIACVFFFFVGLRHGRKLANAEYAEEAALRAKNEKDYKKAKQDIQQEVFKNAEQQKAELSGHSNGVDRFNDINSKLSKHPSQN